MGCWTRVPHRDVVRFLTVAVRIDTGRPGRPLRREYPFARGRIDGATTLNLVGRAIIVYPWGMANRKRPVRYHLPVMIEQDEDGVFLVSVPTLLGCRSYGQTLDEAMNNITEAAVLCLEDEKPSPQAAFVGVRDLEIIA